MWIDIFQFTYFNPSLYVLTCVNSYILYINSYILICIFFVLYEFIYTTSFMWIRMSLWIMWFDICEVTYFNSHISIHHCMNWHVWIHIFVWHHVNWYKSFHISIRFVWKDVYYFVYYFVTYTNHLPSFCSVLTVFTTIPKMTKKKKKKKMKRMRVTKKRPNPMMGNPLGICLWGSRNRYQCGLGCLFLRESSGFLFFPLLWQFFTGITIPVPP